MIFQPTGTSLSNLSDPLQKQHSAVKFVAELKERLVADKTANEYEMEAKQEPRKKAPETDPFRSPTNQTTTTKEYFQVKRLH